MKKIIIFNAGSSVYGTERGLLNLVRALKDKFEIVVVLPQKGILEQKLKDVSEHITIKIFPMPVVMFSLFPLYYFRFLFLSIVCFFYFLFYIKHHAITTVVTNNILILFPAVIAKLCKRKHIWYVREFFRFDALNRMIGSYINGFSDEIICQSDAIRRALCIRGSSAVIYEALNRTQYTIYNQDDAKREFELPADAIVVAIISRIHPSKGQYEFIAAIKSFIKKVDNVFIFIVGDISLPTMKSYLYKYKITHLVKKCRLQRVRLLGARDDIDKILSLADICVFPFRREEPYGIAVSEALAFGKTSFFPYSGGLQEVHEIFAHGEDFVLERIKETIMRLKETPSKPEASLYIPDPLAYDTYSARIQSIFCD